MPYAPLSGGPVLQQIWHDAPTRLHADVGVQARQFRVAIKVSVRMSDPAGQPTIVHPLLPRRSHSALCLR